MIVKLFLVISISTVDVHMRLLNLLLCLFEVSAGREFMLNALWYCC